MVSARFVKKKLSNWFGCDAISGFSPQQCFFFFFIAQAFLSVD